MCNVRQLQKYDVINRNRLHGKYRVLIINQHNTHHGKRQTKIQPRQPCILAEVVLIRRTTFEVAEAQGRGWAGNLTNLDCMLAPELQQANTSWSQEGFFLTAVSFLALPAL